MKKSIIIILIYLFTLSNCGYKISNLQKILVFSKIFTKISHTHTFTPLFDIQTLKTYMPHTYMAFHNRFI